MATESYHNVRLPDIRPTPDDLGLEYTIEPVREDGKPKRLVREMDSLYVVRLRALREDMSPERLARYKDSPICENEFYFCRFLNRDWHLGLDCMPMHKFYLSSKIGPVEDGISANRFMGIADDPPDMQLLTTMIIKSDGTELGVEAGGGSPYKIFRDQNGDLYLKTFESSLKRMYFRNPKLSYRDDDYFFHIEGMRGYLSGDNLSRAHQTILKKIESLGVIVKRVRWFEIPFARGTR